MPRYKFIDEGKKHLHTLDGKPLIGTTTLIKEVMPPPLTWWASGKALEPMGWTNPKYTSRDNGIKQVQEWLKAGIPHTSDQWYDFLQECYRNHFDFSRQRADEGTDTHDKVEQAIREAIDTNGGYLKESYEDEDVQRFAEQRKGCKFLFCEAHVYSEKLWLGGKFDDIYEKDGEVFIDDLKTSKSVYESQLIQAGVYHYQLLENGIFDKDGNKLSDPIKIDGYSVTLIPPKGKAKTVVYRGTDRLREFTPNLTQLLKTIKELKVIVK